ncbi:MAG: TIGR00159 family protein [Phycisphaera sp.]|nr:TIGR00159 family protein [Phycisphaera sp.]
MTANLSWKPPSVDLTDRFNQLYRRIETYPWWVVLVEMTVIWLAVYMVFRFLRGTRGARVIKGMAVVLIIGTLGFKLLARDNAFERLNFLYSNFMYAASLALLVIFHPELRRALVRLGETRFFSTARLRKARVIEEVIASVAYLSKNKIGALIAIQRDVGMSGIVEAGTRMDALVSKELLDTIFWPGSALHDMGVVIIGDRIAAAGVQFPLAEGGDLPSELGSRHRASLGLSQEVDALIIVVSEETGTISVAERGVLERNFDADSLRSRLVKGLGKLRLTPTNGLDGDGVSEDHPNAAA